MSTLIAGLGNVLMGDDAIGPTLIHYLRARYEFEPDVDLLDLGTPGIDLAHHLAGRETVILLDALNEPQSTPGSVRVLHQSDLESAAIAIRGDAHTPDLSESIRLAALHGAPPGRVVLLGITAGSFELGEPMSPSLRQNLDRIVNAIADQLRSLRIPIQRRQESTDPLLWWNEAPTNSEAPRRQ
ncbi:hydrogenase maturation protease [uncultured Paludibaculum sp.]|uniref:hydrogenase maturation protease n=1 Tax=uncultured Paludibaculum sp. TaxID=1765020 RepID=UPI002AAAF117|nr:hydrogenase maturation protease [uncultured Paludibaculum sp.]